MNPDTHLLYEYMNKLPFTVRMKVRLGEPVDSALLDEAALPRDEGASHYEGDSTVSGRLTRYLPKIALP